MLGLGRELLTQIEDMVQQWKKHFDSLPNLGTVSTFEKAESEKSGENQSNSVADEAEEVKKLCSWTPGVKEIHDNLLKLLDVVRLS